MPELCGDDEERKIAGVCIPSGKCINADAAAAERVNLGIAQFTRAIRKTALSALSAAAQLLFAHFVALSSCVPANRFSCEHEICPQEYASEL